MIMKALIIKKKMEKQFKNTSIISWVLGYCLIICVILLITWFFFFTWELERDNDLNMVIPEFGKIERIFEIDVLFVW